MTKIKKNKLHACGTWTNNLEIYFRKCIHKNLIKLVKHFVSFNLKESFWFGECVFFLLPLQESAEMMTIRLIFQILTK